MDIPIEQQYPNNNYTQAEISFTNFNAIFVLKDLTYSCAFAMGSVDNLYNYFYYSNELTLFCV